MAGKFHFTKRTIEATVWCRVCGKPTPHHVHDGRRGSCKLCIARLEAQPKPQPAPPAAVQQEMF